MFLKILAQFLNTHFYLEDERGGKKRLAGGFLTPQNGFCQEWISPGLSWGPWSDSQDYGQLNKSKFSVEFALLILAACSSFPLSFFMQYKIIRLALKILFQKVEIAT